MSLTAKDKEVITEFWKSIAWRADEIGSEALFRLLTVYPQTKTYFTHWGDLSAGSESVKKLGSAVMGGVAIAVEKIDELPGCLLELSKLHAYSLRVDPANFKLISHCILVVLSNMFPMEFSSQIHVCMDKLLAAVARGLSEKYR